MQTYQELHPMYKELEIPEYSIHKLKLVTPDIKYSKASLDWISDKEVGKYMGADFSDASLQGEEQRLNEILSNPYAYHWIIEVDEKAVGNINLNEIESATKEFGVKAGKLNYLIGDRVLWGKGITTAAVKKILEWAFNTAGFELIKSRVVPQNKSSQSVLTKSGFVEYGKEDYDGPDLGETTWYVTYKLTKDDWLKLR
jgi:RimJ/RimL family protein N-acetyltransferase